MIPAMHAIYPGTINSVEAELRLYMPKVASKITKNENIVQNMKKLFFMTILSFFSTSV